MHEISPLVITHSTSAVSFQKRFHQVFSSLYGKVVYQIKVEVKRRLKINRSYLFPFTVITLMDLNYEGVDLRSPLKKALSKNFLLGLSSDALEIIAEIPFCGYVAGQILTVLVEIRNESNVEVEQIFVELRRLIRCQHKAVTKKENLVFVTEQHVGVPKKTRKQMTFCMQIPPVIPTNIRFCKYISITYEITVTAKVTLHRSPVLRIPITIGTVPLYNPEFASTSAQIMSPLPLYEDLNFSEEKTGVLP